MIKVHGGGEIVPATKEHEGVDMGILDYCKQATTWWKDQYKAATLFNYMIAGLRPVEMMIWMITEGNDLLAEMVADTNVIPIPGWTGTPEIFLSTKKPLNTLADFKGLKIRSAGDDGTVLSQMGAAVVSVPPGEIYEAMQRGVIDSFQLSSPSVDYTYAMYEVVDYIYMSPVRQPCEYFTNFVSKKSWAALPDDLKVILEQSALEEGWTYLADTVIDDAKAVIDYQAYGVEVGPIPTEFEVELKRIADEFYDTESAKDAFFAKVVASQRAFGEAYSSTYPSGL